MPRYLIDLFNSMRVVDFVDVMVIASFIYMALVWLERARARFVMIGLFIIASVYLIARFFGLYLTTAVFQAFFAALLIIIVIIFQDDFRHFFEQVALWGIMHKNKKRYISSFYENTDIIISAVAELMRKKIGALIVIKGKDVLERHIEGGVELGGRLSQIMVESIFEQHFPGHDGAIIIDGGKISKFGVHLPLSANVHGVGHFGTRHAAALGLSERTDAVCIVVSEEQGIVSLAEGEIITPVKDVASLRVRLENFYKRLFPQKRKIISDVITGHLVEKFLAIVLACGFWVMFGERQGIVRRDFIVPIEYRNLAADWVIGEPKPKEATAALSGTDKSFNLIDPKALKISLDMSQVKQGENKFIINKEAIRSPAGVSIVNINPNEVSLNIYKLIKIDVPIEIATVGRLPSGFNLKEIKAVPASVSLVIPSIIPKESIKVKTEQPIDLRQIEASCEIPLKIVIPQEARFADEKYPEIKAVIEIEKKE